MRAAYLTGETIYLRALTEADKETTASWYAGPFPINAARAENWLREAHTDIWRANKARYYVIVRLTDDAPVGGATLAVRDGRRGLLTFTFPFWRDDADRLRAEALRIITPWVRNDLELMTLLVYVAADETATIAVAESLGMVQAARLREFVARPGGRADQLLYEAHNAPWMVADA